MSKLHYGPVAGINVGDQFASFDDMRVAGLHRTSQGGIAGGMFGSDSIVVNGGYLDDMDQGDQIIYTGQGQRDGKTKKQIADQELTRGNSGLAHAYSENRPVRVIRGASGNPKYSPKRGYRYDGLYRIVKIWPDQNPDGYRIWRFHLVLDDVKSDASTAEAQARCRQHHIKGRKGGHRKALVDVRNGQSGFRKDLVDKYGLVCAVTGKCPNVVLHAAHLRAFSKYKRHKVAEGLLLRSDIHLLFDTAMMTIDPSDNRVVVSPDLVDYPEYSRFSGKSLSISHDLLPDLEVLIEHHAEVTAGWETR